MTKVISISAFVLVVGAGATAFAQSKPNFSGTWTRVAGPTVIGGGKGGARGPAGMVPGEEFTVTQDEKMLTVVQEIAQLNEVKSVYKLDGKKTSNPIVLSGGAESGRVSINQARYRVSKVKLDGDRLVITTTSSLGATLVDSKQTWALDASGNLTIESTQKWAPVPSSNLRPASTSSAFGGPITTKVTYKKG